MATQNVDALDTRIKELTDENELLLEQLHVVQEEVENYYYRLKECEQGRNSGERDSNSFAVPQQIIEALAENRKLHILVEQQKIALKTEQEHGLAARLGKMLIEGVSSSQAFFSLPFRLRKMWKSLEATVPPAVLGGASFQKVLDAHAAGGIEAVEKLLDSVFLSPAMRANAYTALARQVMLTDAPMAANLARLAWKTDPLPYRLKWLAFRLHEADDDITAEALLDMLPDDISMSESEERQARLLRQESKRERTKQIQQTMKVSQADIGQLQMSIANLKKQQNSASAQLNRERDAHKQELAHLNSQIAELQNSASAQLNRERDAHKQELAHLNSQIAELREKHTLLQRQIETQKEESDTFTAQTASMLKGMLTRFESDKAVLSQVMCVVMGTAANR